MRNCPNCQANVEGLTHHCDCCGALLQESKSFFRWHVFVTSGSGDLSRYVKELFQHLNSISSTAQSGNYPNFVFEIYCYPEEMIQNLRTKNGVYYSKKRNRLQVKIVVDYERYISGSQRGKREITKAAVQNAISKARCRMEHEQLPSNSFWTEVESALNKI